MTGRGTALGTGVVWRHWKAGQIFGDGRVRCDVEKRVDDERIWMRFIVGSCVDLIFQEGYFMISVCCFSN